MWSHKDWATCWIQCSDHVLTQRIECLTVLVALICCPKHCSTCKGRSKGLGLAMNYCINTPNLIPGQNIEKMGHFTNMESVIDVKGGTEKDITSRLF